MVRGWKFNYGMLEAGIHYHLQKLLVSDSNNPVLVRIEVSESVCKILAMTSEISISQYCDIRQKFELTCRTMAH